MRRVDPDHEWAVIAVDENDGYDVIRHFRPTLVAEYRLNLVKTRLVFSMTTRFGNPSKRWLFSTTTRFGTCRMRRVFDEHPRARYSEPLVDFRTAPPDGYLPPYPLSLSSFGKFTGRGGNIRTS